MMNQWDEDYKNLWDERYKSNAFAYGKEPNTFFGKWLLKYTPGSILMPADGEGRNGVYAATLGWKVTSLDLSAEGKSKALQLAEEFGVKLDYIVGDLDQLEFKNESFDAIGLIYAHFSAPKKSRIHQKLSGYLTPGGILIFEAFSKNHLTFIERNPKVGGPRDVDMLFSREEMLADFKDYDTIVLSEEEADLEEGPYHIGTGSVIRFVGRKAL
jgi:SAM-dependent methyltransferase